ncbi:hypothetical protein [Sporomusa sphaeroides]|uniref:Uncharacterized protein n=1 Tax=Sporomusa sphaeroides DSM 2875 TaxID=1337886 RepID=A0A1U7MA21_9FIRM|nr:hypothetical protein [Sporomusa sphaeroides]OLS54317.1 hypothetical protein SPSPH_45630 [Sporomusa sphaeroides DSM 2875]CVK21546.1 hypothetical protein SSPH_04238 [Sporomusa sphaeroides DSM 2875]
MSEDLIFWGYRFYQNGRYHKGVELKGVEAVYDFVKEHKDSFYEVRVVDRSDFTVLQTIEGQIVFPIALNME